MGDQDILSTELVLENYDVSFSGSSETCELISAIEDFETDANGGAKATFSSSCISLFCNPRLCCCNCNDDGESIHNLSCLFISSKEVNVTAAAGVVLNKFVRQPW